MITSDNLKGFLFDEITIPVNSLKNLIIFQSKLNENCKIDVAAKNEPSRYASSIRNDIKDADISISTKTPGISINIKLKHNSDEGKYFLTIRRVGGESTYHATLTSCKETDSLQMMQEITQPKFKEHMVLSSILSLNHCADADEQLEIDCLAFIISRLSSDNHKLNPLTEEITKDLNKIDSVLDALANDHQRAYVLRKVALKIIRGSSDNDFNTILNTVEKFISETSYKSHKDLLKTCVYHLFPKNSNKLYSNCLRRFLLIITANEPNELEFSNMMYSLTGNDSLVNHNDNFFNSLFANKIPNNTNSTGQATIVTPTVLTFSTPNTDSPEDNNNDLAEEPLSKKQKLNP